MGRLSPEKGVADLIAACTRLPESERGQLSLLVIGDGPQRPELEIQAASVPGLRAVFTGPVPHAEAQRYLNCFDVLVLPSRTTPAWREQFGRVIVEAMACGVPVVGSDSGHIPVLIEETGGGSVFPEGDSEALSERLAALASRPEEVRTLGEKGRVAVLERYTYPKIAAQIADVLRGAVDSAPAPD
jgi:glycosyltransferase involved in cell wall biosynthesis